MTIRVSIVEDDPRTRESLAALLDGAEGLACLSTHASAEDALHKIPGQLPDVLLVDINLPGLSGIECVGALTAAHPALQVLMLTTYENTESIYDSLRAGASGYLLKRTPAAEILAAVREVHQGGSPMSAHIARKVVAFFRPGRRSAAPEMLTLTAREQETLSLLAEGLHYKEIGEKLGISTGTVRAHLHSIYRKLHVQSRTEAVIKYLGR